MSPLSSLVSVFVLALSGTAYASRGDSEATTLAPEESTETTEARAPVRQKPRPQGGSSEREADKPRSSESSREAPPAERSERSSEDRERSDRRPAAIRSERRAPKARSHRASRHGHHHSHRPHRYHHVRPYHGVFVYGPPPVHHRRYVRGGPVEVQSAHLPKRKIDRTGSVAVGLQGGSIFSGYQDASGYADAGLGLGVRYRPAEAVGLEATVTHYNQTFNRDSERLQTMGQFSAELFAFPWTRVSPYVLGGVTVNGRQFDDERLNDFSGGVDRYRTADVQWGPHAGLGVEFALGSSLAVDLEARYIGFVNRNENDPTLGGAFQTNAGLKVHF